MDANTERKTARERAAKLIRDGETCAAAIELLPVEPVVCSVYAHKANVRAKYKVKTRAEALELFAKFTPVRMAKVSGTFLSFYPADQATGERDHVDDTIEPVVFEMEGDPRFPSAWLMFYAQLDANTRAQVEITITKDAAQLVEDHERHGGRITRHRWREENFPHGTIHRFAAGDRKSPGRRVVHFDTGPGAPTLAVYLGVEVTP